MNSSTAQSLYMVDFVLEELRIHFRRHHLYHRHLYHRHRPEQCVSDAIHPRQYPDSRLAFRGEELL